MRSLRSENEDAAKVYTTVRGQVLSNGDLNHLAVWAAIDGFGINDRLGTFVKVVNTFHHFMKETARR